MKILVINNGSSTIKYQLFDMQADTVLAAGLLERIGEPQSRLEHTAGSGEPLVDTAPVADHRAGLLRIAALLTDPDRGVIADTAHIGAVGHRVVHGGETFREAVIIDDAVIQIIEDFAPLAPLHNPPNLMGIQVAREIFSHSPHIAVFDTAFHGTIPPHAFHYALPYALYEKHRIRRYGFHGTSHRYLAHAAADCMGRPLEMLNLITIHLGSGASMAAIQNGRSIDTSMGMTPLQGLIMGTRCGDIDPAVPFFLARHEGMDLEQIEELMNKQSGLKGLCGLNDMRDILARRADGDPRATLAVDMYTYSVKKHIGAYMAVLGRVDALVFSAGVGENAALIRALACDGLDTLGVRLDPEQNARVGDWPREVQAQGAPLRILVIHTDEEREIARQALCLIKASGR
jgi:acetate kinase